MILGGGGSGKDRGLPGKGSQKGLMLSPQSRFEVWCCWWMCRASIL